MAGSNPYKNFSKYVLRTPLFSMDRYLAFTSKKNIPDDEFRMAFNDPIIKEALFLASPSLSTEIARWVNGELTDKKKIEKLRFSMLKYLTRMSSRCTPFGLFAGCSVGRFATKTDIALEKMDRNCRHTRLDMNYLVALSQDLIKRPEIKHQLLFFPNTSIYKAGNQLRYVEYEYVNSKRHHNIVAVDDTRYLDVVLGKANKGALLLDLVNVLVNDEISVQEASSFIEELVDSQLLISELEPSVSGPEFLEQICSVLEKLENSEDVLRTLQEAEKKMLLIDSTMGNTPEEYLDVTETLGELGTDFDPRFMFQTDMALGVKTNTLSENVIDDLKKGFMFLNRISIPPQETFLSKFMEAFYERYEEREVPLATALDVEVGLGYVQNQGSGDINPLVDGIALPEGDSRQSIFNVQWTALDSIFQKKLNEAFKQNAYTITLNNEDFQEYEAKWDDLPDTMSCMLEIIIENGQQKIKFSGSGGSSAANLLGRFCHGDKELHEYTMEIIGAETNMNTDKILAEIVHLPESRVGNILMRPDFRKYEIPYLAKSLKAKAFQLTLDDLMISIKNNTIVLRSKKYDKQVIPRLTNAHNYSRNSLPIYHFLADMQTQGFRSRVGINLSPFAENYEFLPRVEYHNLILQNATWHLSKHRITTLLRIKDNDEQLSEEVNSFRESLKIPQFAMLADGDNELLINFQNLTSVRMFLDTVEKRTEFKLTEFLFAEDGVVKHEKAYYTNQVIVSFFNEEKLGYDINSSNSAKKGTAELHFG
ncbi:lantibiotic dehydratase family protein [Ulvibacterium sp.]|uniref:lantibiotic dehydratase family protein n=1 Tax=Ulvibacterium sp. TaxID=2665914 RepID=UPI00261AF450|nr:lantibiotic dehydratase family protein [Ulvibacterium sp.]